ncbi:T9SS type A sorting domain-containing protein [Larkinella sp. VNQ87]|uniref:T9SS type A sorting domain-containing protein n=1 Tax=Larkinella sp. VNQ87 TaxID=3400921 RepID=UPI003C12A662
MKTVFASAFLALTLATATATYADGNKEVTEAKSSFQSAVYPVINTLKVTVNISKVKDSKVNVRLLNEAGQTLSALKLGKDNEMSTIRFDLNNLEDGIYKVEISDGFRTEVKTVKVQTSTPVAAEYRAISLN